MYASVDAWLRRCRLSVALIFCLASFFVVSPVSAVPTLEASVAVRYTADNPLIVNHVANLNQYLSTREKYFMAVLTLALEHSGVPFKLNPVELLRHSEPRGVRFLYHGKFDVHWLNTTKELEDVLLPIRIPLFKGLIGWRVLLIREADMERYAAIDSIDELKQLVGLQGLGWPDTDILLKNGFEVVTATDFFTMSRMLAYSRGDFFPRGVTEIWGELEAYSNPTLTVEQSIALVYPAAYYFFVQKGNTVLHGIIKGGLQAAVDDGSFDALFMTYFGERIARSQLHKRTIFHLDNPYLPPLTPLEQKRYWLSLDSILSDRAVDE
ncbi:amino acid ABC transporter substrate-binding protein [Teredinibacter purpureus]|uniref:amino acid ABC transporter substrate-binding protein n=1 Tax=Teredinibacter purpureus TaxID=2731756 RepID=UPI0013C4643C|nr:amino acid ABC transporter substrate-binding protein [Teredinibacter purpureus]